MKKKTKKWPVFEVTVTRDIRMSAVVEVEARNATEAKEVAQSVVDDGSTRWVEGDIISMETKAKLLRG